MGIRKGRGMAMPWHNSDRTVEGLGLDLAYERQAPVPFRDLAYDTP